MYDQGSKFIGHDFRKYLIEDKYGITDKPSTSGNTIPNAVLELIHQVIGNLVHNFNIYQTYVGKNDLWTGILAAASFAVLSTNNRQKCYSLGQLLFGRDIILLIKHKVDWELVRQKNQAQINKYNIRENRHRVDYDYKVGDSVMFNNHTTYKYETPNKGQFMITQFFTNGTVNLQCGAIKIKYNISHINPYKSDTKVEDSSSKNMSDDVKI